MPNKCAAYGCKSGYDSSETQNVTLHRFPLNNEALLNTWLRRISRSNFTPSSNSRLCSLHFRESDFVAESLDTNITRRRIKSSNCTRAKRQLKPNAVPSIFPNMPGYFTLEAEERPTGATTSIRQQNVNARFEQMETELFQEESISTIEDLIEKLPEASTPSGFTHEICNGNVWFHHIEYETLPPKIACSILVGSDLKVSIFGANHELPINNIAHITAGGILRNISELCNVMAFLKTHSESHFSSIRDHRKEAISSIKVSKQFYIILYLSILFTCTKLYNYETCLSGVCVCVCHFN